MTNTHTVIAILDGFSDQFVEGLSVDLVRGRPEIGREPTAYPVFALEFLGFGFQADARTVGSSVPRRSQLTVALHGYASDEYELCAISGMLMDKMLSMAVVDVSGQAMKVMWGDLVRNYGELESVLDFAVSVQVTLTWRN